MPARAPREAHLRAGAVRAAVVVRARELQADGQSLVSIARTLGTSVTTVWRWLERADGVDLVTAETLADRVYRNGSAPRVPALTTEEFHEVRALYLRTNRTRADGSIPEALLQAMERGIIRPAMADLIRQRMAAGQTPLTERQMHRLRLAGPVVAGSRGPRRAWLEHVQSPGALQVDIDPETGAEAHIQPGQRWTIDDGSINMLVIVPGLEIPGDPCWERHRVVVGRFQLLLTVDHRTRCIIGRSYTARPRDSYRAEDLTAALHACVERHGAPREIVLEKGISAANLVSETLAALGVSIIRANSPHQKVVEGVFSVLWTALSTLPGQVGRYRGEEEIMGRTLQAYRDGRRDPRGELMTLPEFLAALDAAIARCNDRWVTGRLGRWQPSAAWATQTATRPIPATDLWMFCPRITDPLLVDWTNVRTTVPLVPGRSEQFTFSAVWLSEWHGARVKLFFNPLAEETQATAVLAHDWQGHRAGTVLGRLEQVDRLTRYTRRALGYGLDVDIGRGTTSESARALVSSVKAIGGQAQSPIANRQSPTESRQGAEDAKREIQRKPQMDADGRGCRNPSSEPRTTNHEPRTANTPRYVDPRLADMEAELLAELG